MEARRQPRKRTKIIRAGRLAGRRRVFVSWQEESLHKVAWITGFFERLKTETGVLEESFSLPLQTGDELPGDLFTKKGPLETRGYDITDVVGVMTNTYVFENMRESAQGELTRIIEALLERDTADRIRVWLAP